MGTFGQPVSFPILRPCPPDRPSSEPVFASRGTVQSLHYSIPIHADWENRDPKRARENPADDATASRHSNADGNSPEVLGVIHR